MTALDRARAEHVEQQNAEWHDDYPGAEWETPKPLVDPTICAHCVHMTDQHGKYGCTVSFVISGHTCKCPKPGPKR